MRTATTSPSAAPATTPRCSTRPKPSAVQKLNPPGMALGIDSGDVFERVTRDFTFQMETNDCLVLYTDGVTEALDSKGNEYRRQTHDHGHPGQRPRRGGCHSQALDR